ncbi:MAG TPA: histidine kinase dimerization/phosphoacceptor domain-containing protein [Streptosporangiaceae bacterium]|nr:histidine kinase dimerization/phosphoacceptor domain-containing protein [Streptosporangiaceae bacterium]
MAHSLSVVTVQAGVGRRVEAVRPGEALRALRAVEVTGRGALEELRRILGLLRDEAEGASLARAPGIEDLGGIGVGMRERAVAFGGTLDAGPPPGGGFGVSAFLPVRATAGQVTR